MARKEHFPAETNYVYILGAGASFAEDDKFPLMKTVFKDFERDTKQAGYTWSTRYKKLFEWLKNNYGSYESQNIEEVLTYLDYLQGGFITTEFSDENYISNIYSELVDYLDSPQKVLYNEIVVK